MRELLAAPFAATALVLCVAGAAKLRSPGGATRAMLSLGLPARKGLARALGGLEMALGGWCLAAPGRPAALTAAAAYAAFAVFARLLAARQASCGCFGADDTPASVAQSLLSAILAALCTVAAVTAPRSVQWMLSRPVGLAGALAIGVGGCAYALVLAYTLLPAAWVAWSPR